MKDVIPRRHQLVLASIMNAEHLSTTLYYDDRITLISLVQKMLYTATRATKRRIQWPEQIPF